MRISSVDDLSLGWPDLGAVFEEQTPADYGVLLSHAPLAARFVPDGAGIDLVLSGHTHGGQIRFPLLWRRILPVCTGGYIAGLHATRWGHVYVSRGFGEAAWLPLRFRCPAEVAFFEVRPAGT